MHYGALSLIPPLVVIILAIRIKASFEALLIGCIVGFLIVGYYEKTNFFTDFISTLYKVLKDDSTIWVILVCGLYGSLISLMVRSGGALKFGQDMLSYIKTKKVALLGTWGLGLFIFLDDYLSALTVGITMKKITDHFKIPREYLAYIVNTTAAPWCVIVPLSTWTLFVASVLEKSKFIPAGEGTHTYLSIIPFITYSWVSILLIPLFITGILPHFKKMRLAINRAQETGLTIPEGPKISSVPMENFNESQVSHSLYFLLPIVVTLACTFYFDYDALKGVMIGIAFTFIYYLIKKLATFQQLSETLFTGFNSMIYALSLVVISYVLKEVGDKLGLTPYVIESVKPLINKELLPLIIFVAISLITYTTGSSWGVYAVVIPIVIPLAQSLGAHVLMSIGAVISAGVFGANACLYSDATILTSQSTEVNNLKHSFSQLPYALSAFFISCLLYIVLGYSLT